MNNDLRRIAKKKIRRKPRKIPNKRKMRIKGVRR